MKFLVQRDTEGGEAWLTNETVRSRHGLPVLEVNAADVRGSYGPEDLIGVNGVAGRRSGAVFAAFVVAGWGSLRDRTDAERRFARLYLEQWPEGPQLRV